MKADAHNSIKLREDSAHQRYFVGHLVGLHGLPVVGLAAEPHLECRRLPVLLQLRDHGDLWEAVQGRLSGQDRS